MGVLLGLTRPLARSERGTRVHDKIIKLSGRGHDEKQAYRAIELAQEAGNGKWTINIDLLSGLTRETDETWKQSVECAYLEADNVCCITLFYLFSKP